VVGKLLRDGLIEEVSAGWALGFEPTKVVLDEGNLSKT
jgi:hypothetical protein